MPRIRTIKPDAFLSESLSEVPRGTRWTFAGLWTYADDAGRARDDERLIKAALYPLDDSVTLADVGDDLRMLERIGAIHRYIGEDGRRYLHMPQWADHQKINRPTPAKAPPCPDEGSGRCHMRSGEPSLSPHGAVTEPSGWERKGREGKGTGKGLLLRDESRDTEEPELDRFDEFWDVYAKKVDRKKAEQKWRLALKKPDVTADMLIDSAREYVTWERTYNSGGRYVMDPARWLGGERWGDERAVRHAQPARSQVVEGWGAIAQQLFEEENR